METVRLETGAAENLLLKQQRYLVPTPLRRTCLVPLWTRPASSRACLPAASVCISHGSCVPWAPRWSLPAETSGEPLRLWRRFGATQGPRQRAARASGFPLTWRTSETFTGDRMVALAQATAPVRPTATSECGLCCSVVCIVTATLPLAPLVSSASPHLTVHTPVR